MLGLSILIFYLTNNYAICISQYLVKPVQEQHIDDDIIIMFFTDAKVIQKSILSINSKNNLLPNWL